MKHKNFITERTEDSLCIRTLRGGFAQNCVVYMLLLVLAVMIPVFLIWWFGMLIDFIMNGPGGDVSLTDIFIWFLIFPIYGVLVYSIARHVFLVETVRIGPGILEWESKMLWRKRGKKYDRAELLRIGRNLFQGKNQVNPTQVLELVMIDRPYTFHVIDTEGFEQLNAEIVDFLKEVPYDPEAYRKLVLEEEIDPLENYDSEAERNEMLRNTLGAQNFAFPKVSEEQSAEDEEHPPENEPVPEKNFSEAKPISGLKSVSVEEEDGKLFIYKPGTNPFISDKNGGSKTVAFLSYACAGLVFAVVIGYVLYNMIFVDWKIILHFPKTILAIIILSITSYIALWKSATQAVLINEENIVLRKTVWNFKSVKIIPRTEVIGARGNFERENNQGNIIHQVGILLRNLSSPITIQTDSPEEQAWLCERINRFLGFDFSTQPKESKIAFDSSNPHETLVRIPPLKGKLRTVIILSIIIPLFLFLSSIPTVLLLVNQVPGMVISLIFTVPFIVIILMAIPQVFYGGFGSWCLKIDHAIGTVQLKRPGFRWGKTYNFDQVDPPHLKDLTEFPKYYTCEVYGQYFVEIPNKSNRKKSIILPCRNREEQEWLQKQLLQLFQSEKMMNRINSF